MKFVETPETRERQNSAKSLEVNTTYKSTPFNTLKILSDLSISSLLFAYLSHLYSTTMIIQRNLTIFNDLIEGCLSLPQSD